MIKNIFWSNFKINKFLFNNYDYFVNKINCRYVWECHENIIKDLYKKNTTKNHLEIGPGTGYFLKDKYYDSLHLVDINNDILNESYDNLKHKSNNIFKINKNLFLDNNYDKTNNFNDIKSIGLSYVLHCVPGSLDDSLDNLVKNIKQKDVVIFGSTVVPEKAGIIAKIELFFLNKFNVFNNLNHNLDQLQSFSGKYEHEIKRVGNVLLFKIKI